MRPCWFAYDDIPYDKMWADDQYWLPLFLAGKLFVGTFHLDKPASADVPATILYKSIEEVTHFT